MRSMFVVVGVIVFYYCQLRPPFPSSPHTLRITMFGTLIDDVFIIDADLIGGGPIDSNISMLSTTLRDYAQQDNEPRVVA